MLGDKAVRLPDFGCHSVNATVEGLGPTGSHDPRRLDVQIDPCSFTLW